MARRLPNFPGSPSAANFGQILDAKLRILVLEGHASSEAGGAERTMRDFLEAIRGDHEIHLAYMEAGDYVTDPLMSPLYASTLAIDIQPLSFWTGVAAARNTYLLARYVRRNRIDQVISHMVHVSPFLRCVKELTGVPFAIYFKWVLSTSRAGTKAVWGNAALDRAAAVSGFVRDFWVRNGVPADRISVVPEGINVPAVQPRRISAKASLGFAGRIVPEKGLTDLIAAMPTILTCHPGTMLRVAGSFNPNASGKVYRAEVEEQIRVLGLRNNVVFDGFVRPLEGWLEERDLVVIPSTCDDAQPIVMMQAMAAGTPVIASQVGGIPEVLAGEFEDLMVPPRNPALLAKTVCAHLTDANRRERVGAGLRQRCSNLYSRPIHIASLTRALGLSPAPASVSLASTSADRALG